MSDIKQIEWDQSELWRNRIYDGRKQVALVEVRHWTLGKEDEYGRGNNHWNVYAFFYPEHPTFAALNAPEVDPYEATGSMPLHGGQTFFEKHFDSEGKVTSIQVGCDYSHYGDDEYRRYATKEAAYWVFRDAERLVEWVQMRADIAKAEQS